MSDLNFTRINRKYFSKCANIPFDTAVMKTNLGIVVKLNAGWDDLELGFSMETFKKDENGNTLKEEQL